MFRIILRDDFQGTSLLKRKAQIVKKCIQYVFFHGDRGRIQSIEDIGQFLEFKIGLTKKRFPNAFNQLSSRMHNANTTVAKKTVIQRKVYPGKGCKWFHCLSSEDQKLIRKRKHFYVIGEHQIASQNVIQPHNNSSSCSSKMITQHSITESMVQPLHLVTKQNVVKPLVKES